MINDYPGGSKKRVNLAGERIRDNTATTEDYLIFDEWRSAHRAVLNTFNSIIRLKTRGKNVSVAQRHKRRLTILDKLRRFPEMQLARMDDIAGCRMIFKSIDELNNFRKIFLNSKFNHELKNEIDKYDYIKKSKVTGYRGIHDVYEYNVRSEQGKRLKGLKIEIQYRTLIQHAWATTVELIGFITESQPKFQQGDKRYETLMVYASEILARAHEGVKGPLPDIENNNLVKDFLKKDSEINLLRTLKGLNSIDIDKSKRKNFILIFDKAGKLETRAFESATDALKVLFNIEKENSEKDVVLVKADSSEEIRLAYKNYFSDAKDFLKLIEAGCIKLAKK